MDSTEPTERSSAPRHIPWPIRVFAAIVLLLFLAAVGVILFT